MSKLEDLLNLKVILKNGLKYHLRNVSFLERNYNIWGVPFLLKIGEFMLNH